MRLKLRPYNGQKEEIVEVSKSDYVSYLKELACQLFHVDADYLDLIFYGKVLDLGTPLLVLKLKDNDVVGLRFKLMSNNNEENEECFKFQERKREDSEDEVQDTEKGSNKYFEVKDIVYYQDSESGNWLEASVVATSIYPGCGQDEIFYTLHDGVSNQDKVARVVNMLPCADTEYQVDDIKEGMELLAYVDNKTISAGWYIVNVTYVGFTRNGEPKVIGTVIINQDKTFPSQVIQYCYKTLKLPKLVPRAEWNKSGVDCFSLDPPCHKCKQNPTRNCVGCSCAVCGGKHDEEKQLICEECDKAYHMDCVDPPVIEMPEDDWFCPGCSHVDKTLELKYKKSNEKKLLKAKESSNKALKNRDWGKGMSTAAVGDKFCVVPKDHFGKIPGVPSGRLWNSRLQVCRFGVHRPPVAGISGTVNTGVESVCFSGGYDGDYDDGFEFVMSGSGGRDLSGNKRTNMQSCSQTLTSSNLALAQSCHAKVCKQGATSEDWKKGLPIRVVRGYKLAKLSKFAPQEGYRYDGIYKVVKYYKEKRGKNDMWKYLLRRDDEEPAPWTSEGKSYMQKMGVGHLEEEKPVEELEQGESSRKRKASTDELNQPVPKKLKIVPYQLDSHIKALIKKDVLNKRNWETANDALKLGYPSYIKALAQQFSCIICQEVAKDPFTPACSHNICLLCMQKWAKGIKEQVVCPLCQQPTEAKPTVNRILDQILNMLLPGYNPKEPKPKPFYLVNKQNINKAIY